MENLLPEDEHRLPDPKLLRKLGKIEKAKRLKREELEKKQLHDPDEYIRALKRYIHSAKARPLREPQAYGYARVSSDMQYEKGDSINVQIERIKNYYNYSVRPRNIGWGGLEFDEQGVSARFIPFGNRPAGRRILEQLRPGDHVIFDRLDRGWRNIQDFCRTLDFFIQSEIHCHFLDLQIDTSSAIGKLLAHVIAVIAQFESEQKGERIRERNAWARQNGYAVTNSAASLPLGVKIKLKKIDPRQSGGKTTAKVLAWDGNMRYIMRDIVHRHEELGMSFPQIARAYKIFLENNEEKFMEFGRRAEKPNMVRDMYCCEIYYRDHQIEDVKDVPRKCRSTARKYYMQLKQQRQEGNGR